MAGWSHIDVQSISGYLLLCGWMLQRILAAMILRGDHFIWLVITQHGVNDLADFVHDSADSNRLLPGRTFACVKIVDYRIYGFFCPLVYLKVINRNHMKDAPCQGGTTFGHMNPVPGKFTGLFHCGVKAKVCKKLRLSVKWR